MVDIGFVDVVEKTFLVPVNGWPIDPADKEIGNWYCLNFLKFAGAFTKLLEAGGLPTDEIPQFQDQLRYDFTSQHMRVYVPCECTFIDSAQPSSRIRFGAHRLSV